MKLSFLIKNLGVRGSIRRVVELSNHMTMRGHEVTIYHSDGSPCSWLTCYAQTAPEAQFTDDEHNAAIFFGDMEHWEMFQKARISIKCLYILGINERDPDLIPILTGDVLTDERTTTIRAALRASDVRILANCTMLVRFMRRQFGIRAYPVVGGINFDVFHPRGGERDPLMVLAGGAARRIEGTIEVLQTLEIVRQTIPEVHLELYANRGYSQIALAELYSRAAVFLDCQHHGGWNNPVAESMACGTPVVCNGIWGNQDFAKNNQTALIAESPEKLAQAICYLLKNPDVGRRLSERALVKISPFTWSRAADQLEAALK